MSTTGVVFKKARAPAKPATHPPFKTMIKSAIIALSADRKKASRQAINKHIFANNITVEDNSANRQHINRALARMATSGAITRKSGTGASGSFRPAPKPAKPAGEKKKKVVKVVRKVSAGTPKKKKKLSTKKTTGVLKAKSPGKKTTKGITKKTRRPAKKPAVKKTVSVKKVAATTKKTTAMKAPAKK